VTPDFSEASCRDADPRLFEVIDRDHPDWPTKGEIGDQNLYDAVRTKQAKNLKSARRRCATCPVFTECYLSASKDDFKYTIRAGVKPTHVSVDPNRTRNGAFVKKVHGSERVKKAEEMKVLYDSGFSITQVADKYKETYDLTRVLLIEVGTTFRRVGRPRKAAA
jgi:transcription factor WhiB/helix-turn-helix protein